jgi:hypothetical protein
VFRDPAGLFSSQKRINRLLTGDGSFSQYFYVQSA